MTDFKLFQKYFKEYQVKFGLTGYSVYFKHVEIDGCTAQIEFNVPEAVVTVSFNKSVHRSAKDIRRSAKHEAIHLMIARLESNANYRFSTRGEIHESSEELTVRLEGLIK